MQIALIKKKSLATENNILYIIRSLISLLFPRGQLRAIAARKNLSSLLISQGLSSYNSDLSINFGDTHAVSS